MELARRIFGWQPANLPTAYVVASLLSSLAIITMVLVWVSLASERLSPRSLSELLTGLALTFLVVGIPLAMFIAVGLALFGLWPTLLLKRYFAHSWTWLVAIVWGGVSGAAWFWAVFIWSSAEFDLGGVGVLFAAGAVCGAIWWTLARRVIKQDFEAGFEDSDASP